MTDIYLTISLSTHNGDDTPQSQQTANVRRKEAMRSTNGHTYSHCSEFVILNLLLV